MGTQQIIDSLLKVISRRYFYPSGRFSLPWNGPLCCAYSALTTRLPPGFIPHQRQKHQKQVTSLLFLSSLCSSHIGSLLSVNVCRHCEYIQAFSCMVWNNLKMLFLESHIAFSLTNMNFYIKYSQWGLPNHSHHWYFLFPFPQYLFTYLS